MRFVLAFGLAGLALLAGCSALPPAPVRAPAQLASQATPATFGPGDYCASTLVMVQPTARLNFSLGSEYYRNGDYCSAYPYMKWMLANEPLFTGEDPDDRNYLRMASIYEDFAAHVDSTNQAERVAYLDSALAARWNGVEALQREGIAYDAPLRDLREGVFFYQHGSLFADGADREFAAFRRAFEARPDSLDDWYLLRLFELSADRLTALDERTDFLRQLAEQADRAETRTYLAGVADFLENPHQPDLADTVVQNLVAREADGTLEGEDVLVLLSLAVNQPERVEAAGGDPAAIQSRLARRREVTENLRNPLVLNALAQREFHEGNAARGEELFAQALGFATSPSMRADFYYARAAHGFGNRPRLLEQALSEQPGHGPSLFLRESEVAAAAGQPTSVRGRFVYWCLADRFRRVAASGDPRVVERARQQADLYEAAAPTLEQAFLQEGIGPGETVTASLGAYGTCTTRAR